MTDEWPPDVSALNRRMAQEADPTVSSALPPDALEQIGKDERFGYPIMQDKEGATYVRIPEGKNGPTQQFVARFLKRWVNVSDIVAMTDGGKTSYYSKVMPLERIAQPTSENDLRADAILMNGLFGDYDHILEGTLVNLQRDKSTNRAAFYDFDKAKSLTGRPDLRTENLYLSSENVLPRLIQKAEVIEEYLKSDDGREYLADLVKASGWTTEELFELRHEPGVGEDGQLDGLRATLLRNLERTKAAALRVLGPVETKKAA